MRGKTSFVGFVVVVAVASALGERDFDAVQAAAFRELQEAAPGHDASQTRSLCLAVSSGNPEQWRSRRDPAPNVLAKFGVKGAHAYPASRCLEDAGGVWDPFHRAALFLSVGRLEWVSRDFVKTEGYWLLDGLSAQGFKLTLSRVRGEWRVDMAVPTWVS